MRPPASTTISRALSRGDAGRSAICASGNSKSNRLTSMAGPYNRHPPLARGILGEVRFALRANEMVRGTISRTERAEHERRAGSNRLEVEQQRQRSKGPR